ncbi:MAG: transglutaminase-like domain-containing protein [Phycisphaeraceae bacterium]
MKRRIIGAWVIVVLAVAVARGEDERWYVVSLQGQPAGYSVERETRTDGKITSVMEMRIAVGRAGAGLTVRMESEFVETADGRPISAKSTQMLGASQTVKEVVFNGKELTVTTTDSGRTSKQTAPAPEGEWLTPAAGMRYVAAQMAAGEKVITYRSFDPSASMSPIDVTITVLGREDVEVFGKVTPATKVEAGTSLMPGVKSVEYVDDQGHTLRNSVSLGFMTLEMMAADKTLALTERKGPELLEQTLIRMDQAIAEPRILRRATWVLEMKKGKLPQLLETAAQSVKRVDERTAEVTVDMTDAKPQAAEAPVVENSTMIDGKDPRIVKLTEEALKNAASDATAARKAEMIRRFVHRYIKVKSLDVGMASASEVARTRTGDCTEHAVLLAAMLRAAGLPSRVITGLMYVPTSVVLGPQTTGATGVFGYHMWAQAWLNGRWVDLDAVIPDNFDNEGFDATHIAISSSELADGQWINDLVTLAPIIGELKITRGPTPAIPGMNPNPGK